MRDYVHAINFCIIFITTHSGGLVDVNYFGFWYKYCKNKTNIHYALSQLTTKQYCFELPFEWNDLYLKL